MIQDLIYMPIFRARQQEIIVLKETDFGDHTFPLIEIIKEKDRKNNAKTSFEIYSELVNVINAEKVFIDLPTYLRLTNSTNNEVVAFSRSVSENIAERINFLDRFRNIDKAVPVISSLIHRTGELNTIRDQFNALRDHFPIIAFRTFHNTFDKDIAEINAHIRPEDVLIYDLDSVSISSPILRVHRTKFNPINAVRKVLIRSAINSDIQNVSLEHGEIVADAENSQVEYYTNNGFNAFGDYVGIKKDDLSSGGTISPGFLIFDPFENWFYGYKGEIKSLAEFEKTIVPDVLNSEFINRLQNDFQPYYNDNLGIETLRRISAHEESGKSQAKFKKIAMEHYLHCIIKSLNRNEDIPLSSIND